MKFVFALAAVLVSAPLAANAPETQVTDAAKGGAQSKPADPDQKRMCRKVVVTGSRIGSRVCGTVAEFKAMDAQLKKGALEAFENSQKQARAQRVDQSY